MNNSVNKNEVEEIGKLILQNGVIPIVGYDLLHFYEGKEDFIKKVIQNIDRNYLPKDANADFEALYPTAPSTELINYTYHLLDIQRKKTFNSEFRNAINKVRAEIPLHWDPIIKLAKIKNFNLYVNATCTNVLEIALNSYRSTDKMNGYEVYSSTKLNGKDLPVPDVQSGSFDEQISVSNIKKPTLYNLFGTHNTDSRYLLTDVNHIDLLTELLQNESFCPNFKNYLSHSSLLFIGCSFSEWFLRFFIRFWSGPKMDEKLSLQINKVIDSLNETNVFGRSFFLSNFKIAPLGGNSIEFIDALYDYLKERNFGGPPEDPDDEYSFETNDDPLEPPAIRNTSHNNYVLLSYNTLDREIVLQIREQLSNANIDAWMDVGEMSPGADLDRRIARAVSGSCLVIQIASTSFQQRTENDPYFLREWRLIHQQNARRMTFFIDDVNENTIVPANLIAYNDVIRATNRRGVLGWQLEKEKWKVNQVIPDDIIAKIRDIQYQALIKDIKFK